MAVVPNSRNPDLAEVLEIFGHKLIGDINTCLPGRLESWDPKKQTGDVKPLVKRLVAAGDGTEILEELPVIPDVPIGFIRGGKAFVSMPLKAGDYVWIQFSQSSIDAYLAGSGNDTDPGDFRRFDLSDAIAYTGIAPLNNALKDVHEANIVIGFDDGGMQIHVTPDGKLEFKVDGTADKHVAIGEALQVFWDAVVTPWMIAHQHPTGVGPSGPPITAAAFPPFDLAIISALVALKGP